MRSFDEVKEIVLKEEIRKKKIYESNLEKAETSEEKNAATVHLRIANDAIDNIDEVTLMEIGRDTNWLIKMVKNAFNDGSNLKLFFNDFDKFCEDVLISKSSKYCVVDYLSKLGIDKDDLSFLKARDDIHPGSYSYGDIFRERVNSVMGTNIPMVNDLIRAEQYYNETNYSDKAYIDLMEMKRDAGSLGYILSKDEEYNRRKANVSKKNL